jgi:hypothetical protein
MIYAVSEALTYLLSFYGVYLCVIAYKWLDSNDPYKDRSFKEKAMGRAKALLIGNIGFSFGYMILNIAFLLKLGFVVGSIEDPMVLEKVMQILTITEYEIMWRAYHSMGMMLGIVYAQSILLSEECETKFKLIWYNPLLKSYI